jgi:hypothetical protein
MLENSNLKANVNSFLQNEIDTQNQETVLALITLLQSVPAFNWLDWIKKLLNEKSRFISFYTRQLLLSQLEQSQNNLYNLLIRIKNWLPKEQLKRSDYTQAQVYALRLIYKYSHKLSSKLEFNDYGCYPSKYQLFASLDDSSIDEKLKLLVGWIFHPGQQNFVDAPVKEASRLIADWFSILYGLDNKKANPNSLALADKLILQVIAIASYSQQRELIQHWNEQTKSLLAEANKYQKAKNRAFQKSLMQKRYSIRHLIERFIKLQHSVRNIN